MMSCRSIVCLSAAHQVSRASAIRPCAPAWRPARGFASGGRGWGDAVVVGSPRRSDRRCDVRLQLRGCVPDLVERGVIAFSADDVVELLLQRIRSRVRRLELRDDRVDFRRHIVQQTQCFIEFRVHSSYLLPHAMKWIEPFEKPSKVHIALGCSSGPARHRRTITTRLMDQDHTHGSEDAHHNGDRNGEGNRRQQRRPSRDHLKRNLAPAATPARTVVSRWRAIPDEQPTNKLWTYNSSSGRLTFFASSIATPAEFSSQRWRSGTKPRTASTSSRRAQSSTDCSSASFSSAIAEAAAKCSSRHAWAGARC